MSFSLIDKKIWHSQSCVISLKKSKGKTNVLYLLILMAAWYKYFSSIGILKSIHMEETNQLYFLN